MKILIVDHGIEDIGGVTNALINLLRGIVSEEGFDLSLLLFDKTSCTSAIPEGVRLRRPPYLPSIWFAPRKKLGFLDKICWYLLHGVARLVGESFVWKIMIAVSSFDDDHYDVAIAYENDLPEANVLLGTNDYVVKRVKSSKKIAYVHNDPCRLGFTYDYMLKRYRLFDGVIGVSKACADKLIDICPDYAQKVQVARNFAGREAMPPKNMRTLMRPRIVSVGRLDNKQKRIDRIIDCCAELKSCEFGSFVWDVYGSGPDKEKLEKYARRRAVDDVLKFKGVTKDAVATIRHYDLFVLASDYEAYPLVLLEARSAGTVVLCTDFEEAYESVIDGKTGFIVPKDASEMANIIIELFEHPDTLFAMERFAGVMPVDDSEAKRQFFEVVGFPDDDRLRQLEES